MPNECSKHKAYDHYLVSTVDGAWCETHKFNGSQLRACAYRINDMATTEYQMGYLSSQTTLYHLTTPVAKNHMSSRWRLLYLLIQISISSLFNGACWSVRMGRNLRFICHKWRKPRPSTVPVLDPMPKKCVPDKQLSPHWSERIEKPPIDLQDYVIWYAVALHRPDSILSYLSRF